jgi:outer membrane protein assembly factor BamE
MQKACRIIVVALALASLGGCSYFQFPGVFTLEVQQGNIIEQEMIDQLKPGMTKRQVKFVMGSALIMDTFDQDRWDYVYTIRTRSGERRDERMTIYFKDDKLSHFSGDYRPSAPESEAAEPVTDASDSEAS